MKPAHSLAAFEADPTGHWLAGASYVYWCARPTLYGFSLWGRPGRTDIEALTRALVLELKAPAVPHCSVVDTSLVEGVDAQAFEVLQRYVQRHHAALKKQVTRLALVRPKGLVGAVVSGFYEVLESPYPTRAFDDFGAAFAWLGHDAETAEAVRALRGALTGVAPLLTQLRSALAELGPGAEVAQAARAVSLSQRTLQRRLAALGTSFQQELTRRRIAEAQRLMTDSAAPLTEIAIDAGFASLAHFSAAFKKATGCAPSAWRVAHARK